jgi:hypothetical protein
LMSLGIRRRLSIAVEGRGEETLFSPINLLQYGVFLLREF